MKTSNPFLQSFSIMPLSFNVGLNSIKFHSWDVSNLEHSNYLNSLSEKEIILVPGELNIPYQTLLEKYSLKICEYSPNYLFGLLVKLESKNLIKEFWGNYFVAIEPTNPPIDYTKQSKSYLAADLSVEPYLRLTLAYESNCFECNYLILAEKL